MLSIAAALEGQFAFAFWEQKMITANGWCASLKLKAGGIIFNNVPTGVEVTYAMVHGGPTNDRQQNHVCSTNAIFRFYKSSYVTRIVRIGPVADELKNENSTAGLAHGKWIIPVEKIFCKFFMFRAFE